MPSKKALKTDTEAELLLLSQIEKFAVENDFDIDLLYDVDLAEELFGPELNVLRRRISECDVALAKMENHDRELASIWWKLVRLNEDLNIDNKVPSLWFNGSICHSIFIMHYNISQRRSNFRRRAWEISTYIKACRRCRDLSKSYAPISQTVTQHMWEAVRRGAHPA